MINKKAQADKALTFVIFIVVVVLMAIFLTLAAAIAGLHGPGPLTADSPALDKENFLLKGITLSTPIEGGTIEKKFLVLNAYIELENPDILSRQIFEDSLRKFLDEKNNKLCILLAKGPPPNPAGRTDIASLSDDFYLCTKDGKYYSISYYDNLNLALRDKFIEEFTKKYRKNNLIHSVNFINKFGETTNIEYGFGPYFDDI